MTELFQLGNFTSHAGLPLKWKLECDSINDYELKFIEKMIMDYQQQPFCEAVGIPRGGLKLADALNEYATGDSKHFILICDDVFTTGTSMKEFIEEKYPNFSFSLLLGADNVAQFDRWKDHQKLVDTYPIYVYPRKNYSIKESYYSHKNLSLIHI